MNVAPAQMIAAGEKCSNLNKIRREGRRENNFQKNN
jgi:hypothetical protein